MKKTRLLALIALVAIVSGLATSCGDDDGWGPNPPANAYYDDELEGSWILTTANSTAVTADDTNYMTFYSNGKGTYRYYSNGTLLSESFTYYCQRTGNSKIINITYESGTSSTMNYWFTDDDDHLWLQWDTNNGSVTYMYTEVD